MAKKNDQPIPAQTQKSKPGLETQMTPRPKHKKGEYRGSGKLDGKVAIITEGDSGIGRAVAVLFAREGADVAIMYLNEHEDAEETKRLLEVEGRRCLTIAGDVRRSNFCKKSVEQTVQQFGRLDILVNNAATQTDQKDMLQINDEQWDETFRTNIYSYFFMARAAIPHLRKGSVIINTTSVTAYRGASHLLDYSSTKGAILTFTRSLALMLVNKEIRVNAVAPGPIWTPLIPATFPRDKVANFGSDVPMGRPGQPEEVAPCYVFLASSDSSYITGQVLHPNGGEIVNG